MTEREYLVYESWRQGILDWKLREHQVPLYATLNGASREALLFFIKCARRFGKTFTVLLWLMEQGIRSPLIARYAAPTEKSLKKYVHPNMRTILADCPGELRPRFYSADSMWVWPNGFELHVAGTDKDHVEKLRGPRTDIAVCDEAGTMDRLSYVVKDVLMPSTLDTGGRILVISTPPPTPDHDFTVMAAEAQANGNLFVRTVDDNTWLKSRPGLLAKYVEAMGGEGSSTWRREMLCEDVVDETLAVLPEFTPEAAKRIVVPWPRPSHFEPYEAMDPGFSPSKTGVLFGYYDFKAAKLIIEDELELDRMRTDLLASGLKAKEEGLWPDRKVEGKVDVPHRWSDIEPILLNDLGALHGLAFAATSKDLLDVMVNKARLWVQQDRIRINPRCKSLAAQAPVAVFSKSRQEFAYSSRFGHYDLLAALIYMVRNCPEARNPYPLIPEGVASTTHHIPIELFRPTGNAAAIDRMFRWRPTR